MPSYPLPTEAPTVSPTGITAPQYQDLLLSRDASAQAIFGADIYLGSDSQDGQLIAITQKALADANATIIALYNALSVAGCSGTMLSAIVKINGLQRQSATNSTVVVTLSGDPGTLIPIGMISDPSGNIWTLPPNTVISETGSGPATATAQQPGAITLAADSLTEDNIYTPILGWTGLSNPGPAAVGQPVESDAALRQRQIVSTSLPAQTPKESIEAAIANVAGVTRSSLYVNNTNVTDGNGVPSHTISAIVLGGDITDIANAIESKKAPGIGTYGTTNVPITDPAGMPITINFFELTLVPIYVSVTVTPLTGFVSTTEADIQNAVAAFINGLAIGETVYYNWINGVAQQITLPEGQTYKITALTTGIAPTPVGTTDIVIAFNAAATCLAAHVVVTVA